MLGAATVAFMQPLAILGASEPVSAQTPLLPVFLKQIPPVASIEPTSLAEQPEAPPYVPPAPPPPPKIVSGVISGCGDNFYANYIYMHESGCNTNALNSIGCYGIGQACPASKIARCGADYACQNAWFTNYANSAYGGWAGAYSFWVSHRWW